MKCCETTWEDDQGVVRRFYHYGISPQEFALKVDLEPYRESRGRLTGVGEIEAKFREEVERRQGRTRRPWSQEQQQHFFDPYLGRGKSGTMARGADPHDVFARDESRRLGGLGGGALI